MFSFILNIIVLCLLGYDVIGFELDCSDNTLFCNNTNIRCLPEEDCFITCNSAELCMGSTFHCPLTGDCNIECRGDKSCSDSIVNATFSSGNLNILCADSMDHCRRLKVLGSDFERNNGDTNILCNGDLTSCMDSEIDCPDNGDCFISCNADTSCKYAKINGPVNGDLTVNCNGRRSCMGATFDGLNSFSMEISGCIKYGSCFDISLYCPPNTNETANCFIQGNDNLGKGDIGEGTKIYAVNGWKDISIDYSGNYDKFYHSGTMFCGFAYDNQCDIAPDDWSCIDKDNYCENIGDIITMFTTDIGNTEDIAIDATSVTLGDLTRNFEHGAMGMLIVGGGLIVLAIGCVICGTIKKALHKAARKLSDIVTPKKKGYTGAADSHHIEEIIDQMEDAHHHHHQQQQHHQHQHQHHKQGRIQMETLR